MAGMRVGVVVLMLGVGCSPAVTVSRGGDEDYVGRDAQVELATLKFKVPAEETRFNKVHGCFAAQAGEWRHYPLRKIGNFVQEDWCRGQHDKNCAGGSFRSDRGDEWFEVYTLYYDKDWPQVFGLGVSAGRLPREGEWGVSFSYRANGAQIVGEGVAISFHRFAGEKIVQQVDLGNVHVYEVEETRIEVRAPGTQDDELARLIASPESLRDTAVARLDALLAETEKQIAENVVRKCVYGPYEGNGIPPVCAPTPLTAEERAAALAKARAELGGRRDAVNQHAPEFFKMVGELMAFERCW